MMVYICICMYVYKYMIKYMDYGFDHANGT